MTLAIAGIAWGQHLWQWEWALSGSARGLERAVGSVTAVLAHNGTAHLWANTWGLVAAVLVEALLGRKWLVAAIGVAVADMWVFTPAYEQIAGASGLVMASTGMLLGVLPAAWLAGAEGRRGVRARLLYGAGSFAVLHGCVSAWNDVTGLGQRDHVAHGAHLRCLAAGACLGLVKLAMDVAVMRRERQDACADSPARQDESLAPIV